jgi:hypothetical protein
MLGGMRVNIASLILACTSPGEAPEAVATPPSNAQVALITKAAGTPLPVASPTAKPTRPSSSSKNS